MKSQLTSKTLYILNTDGPNRLYLSSRKKEDVIGTLFTPSQIEDYHTFVINKPDDITIANIVYRCISNDIDDDDFIEEICCWICKWWKSRCEDYFIGFHSHDGNKQITHYMFKHMSIHYREFLPLIEMVERVPMIQSFEMSKLLELIDTNIFRRIIDNKAINAKHIDPIYLICNKWIGEFLEKKGNEYRIR